MPALPFVLKGSVSKQYNKRQVGIPPGRPLPVTSSDKVAPPSLPLRDQAIEIDPESGDGDEELEEFEDETEEEGPEEFEEEDEELEEEEPDTFPVLPGLPAEPITVTVITTLGARPTPSIPISASLPTNTISGIGAQPSVSVVPSSPVSGAIGQPSNVISSTVPQPSAPLSAVSPSGSSSSDARPTASVGGGVMLSDKSGAPVASAGIKDTKLPTGAIVGIVLGIAAILLLAGIFLARKTILRRRNRLRDDVNWPQEKSYTTFSQRLARKTIIGSVTPYPFKAPSAVAAPPPPRGPTQPQPQLNIPRIPPPPITPSIAPPHFSSTAPRPALPLPHSHGVVPPPKVPRRPYTVRSTFITTLTDEMNIKIGERMKVLIEYDDGWALCEKVETAEQGMVPMECIVEDSSDGNVGRMGSLRNVA